MNENAVQTIKDKVFAALFNSKEHILEIYNAFHPEETPLKPNEVSFIQLGKYLDAGHYDAGFLAKDTHMILMETQNELAVSYSMRLTLSLPEMFNEYLTAHRTSMHSVKPVVLPRPEFYVIYTGLGDTPPVFRLSELIGRSESQKAQASPGNIDLEVRIIKESGTASLLDQYIRFCRIADEMLEKYEYTSEADAKTIELCMEKDILVSILSSLREN